MAFPICVDCSVYKMQAAYLEAVPGEAKRQAVASRPWPTSRKALLAALRAEGCTPETARLALSSLAEDGSLGLDLPTVENLYQDYRTADLWPEARALGSLRALARILITQVRRYS